MPRGRQKLPIDKEELSKWARAGAHLNEIAQRLGVSERTLCRRLNQKEYRDLIPKAQAELRISLRTKQVQLALAGNVTMLIWLGKQMLGQKDKLEQSGELDATLNIDAADPISALRARVAGIAERERAAGVLPIADAIRTGTD